MVSLISKSAIYHRHKIWHYQKDNTNHITKATKQFLGDLSFENLDSNTMIFYSKEILKTFF